MELYISIPLFIVSLILVIKGGDIFVDSASKIATKSKIPPMIIGATIVSVTTTLPELIVSSIASIKGSFDLAIGNAIGSIICNTSLICAISLMFMPTILKQKQSNFKNYMLLFVIALCAVFSIGIEDGQVAGQINLFEGLMLLVMFAVFMIANVTEAKKDMKNAVNIEIDINKKKETKVPEPKQNETEAIKEEKYSKLITIFIIGAFMVGLGAYALVESATAIATSLHIPESVIGLTIVAIGTSLPELVTTITAIRKKNSTLGYGNIVGANILNVALILGVSSLISGSQGLPIGFWTLVVSIPVAFVSCAIFLIPLCIKQRTYRWQGFTLIAIYIAYMAFLTIMTIKGVAV